MKHATHLKHSKPFRATQIALVLIVALAAAAAAQPVRAQTPSGPQAQAGQAGPAPRQPAPATGPSYGPVLHPQTTRSEPGAQPEQTPQAQEEKAGGTPQQQPHRETDPSARPAPQQRDPAKTDSKGTNKQTNAAARRPARQDIARVPGVQPDTVVTPPIPSPARPAAPQSGSARLNSCLGNTCTDTGGTTYQTNVGNAGVSSEGRLCTRNGANVQCF